METERKPLGSKNVGHTPGGSRLPVPGSWTKPPAPNTKRPRSPEEEENTGKKGRYEDVAADLTNISDILVSSTASSTVSSTGGVKAVKSKVQPAAAGKRPGAPGSTRPGLTRTTSAVMRPPAQPAASQPASRTLTRGNSASNLRKPAAPRPTTSVPAARASIAARPPTSTRPSVSSRPSAPPRPSAIGGKRKPWDLKGRLEDMEDTLQQREDLMAMLHSQLESYNSRINQLESQNSQLSGTVAQKEEQTSAISQEVSTLRQTIREKEDDLENCKRSMRREIEDLVFSKSTLERQKESLEGELTASQREVAGLRSTVAELTSTHAKVNSELEGLKLSLEQAHRELRGREEEISVLQAKVASQEASLQEAQQKMREHETMRRKLHNVIQELKGNIRVFCRVRPLLGEERLGNDGVISHMTFPDPDQRVLELEKLAEASMNESCLAANRKGQNKYEFSFDKVFQPESSQTQVFEEISQLVQSALDGYNVCIFAYGQTGSGKTFTMEGPPEQDEEAAGMIPRAVEQIFLCSQELADKGWQYKFDASMVEIYNETLRDLLASGKEEAKLEVKLVGKESSEVMVSNMTVITVTSQSQVRNLLRKASHNRAVAETKCNERSSRSHSVFILKLHGTNELTGETCHGTLNLVDLAGSERLKESGSEGLRLKETQAINKSLSNLGNVIMALANKESYIPYRNSKLTYLLQNSLGGNSKTLMFVNVSPKEDNFQETLNSLRFATKVNQCNIGTAQKKLK